MNYIERAKQVLKQNGFFVDNLWHIDDVMLKHEGISPEKAMEVLNTALTNEATMDQIWYAIEDAVDEIEEEEDSYED